MMDIDFVVLWVDGNDLEWQKEKEKYQTRKADDSNAVNRFRDWGLMPYWFRAIETYCPWVRKVHFVTCGHVPDWLNLDCPKLNHVKHKDYIPARYLPTFNANTIEMNIHRIPELTEQFVFFNDDMFVLRPLRAESFFCEGLPCAYGGEEPYIVSGQAGIWQHLIVNDLRVINNHFNKTNQAIRYKDKYTNKKYRWKDNIRTRLLQKLYPDRFLGFRNLHAPAAFCKNTFETLWEQEEQLLHETCTHRFRTNDDVNQWLAIWWQVADGCFAPYRTDNVVEDVNSDTIKNLCNLIKNQRHDMVCINDPSEDIQFELLSEQLKDAFDRILPEKSSFEK